MLDKLKQTFKTKLFWIYLTELVLLTIALSAPFLNYNSSSINLKLSLGGSFSLLKPHAAGYFTELIPTTVLMLISFFWGVGLIVYCIISLVKKYNLSLAVIITFIVFSILALGIESYFLALYIGVYKKSGVFANAGYYAVILLALFNIACLIIRYKPLPTIKLPAHRPTKSERIALLEKEVAELKEKNRNFD
jgi:hypothetical protein